MKSVRFRSPWAMWSSLRSFLSFLRLLFFSLTYNEHFSFTYAMDTFLAPMVLFIETTSRVLGRFLFVIVVLLHLVVVSTSYVVGLPFYVERYSSMFVLVVVVVGNWLLMNVLFHMSLVVLRGPGYPPRPLPPDAAVVNVCKRCIKPKVARSHHCSICQRCVLKMDHHCPWLNSCIGHNNHKHFLLYVLYTVLGCTFLVLFGFHVLMDELHSDPTDLPITFKLLRVMIISRRSLVFLQSFLALGSLCFLSVLLIWHIRLVSRGETSIEEHINKAELARNKNYVNPYDLGLVENWKRFMGAKDIFGVVMKILIPSADPPRSNGLTWKTRSQSDLQGMLVKVA